MPHLEFTRANTTGVIRGGRLRIVQMPSAQAANPGQSANSIPGMLHKWIGKQQEPVRPCPRGEWEGGRRARVREGKSRSIHKAHLFHVLQVLHLLYFSQIY